MKTALSFLLLISFSSFAQSIHWNYSAPHGPNQWGTMPGFSMCQTGTEQSPVAIETGAVAGISNVTFDSSLEDIQIDWMSSAFRILNNGHTLQMVYDPGSKLSFKGNDFSLNQFHFHSPSEHMLDEKQYPLEVHFVHSDAQGKLLVVGVFFEVGEENPILKSIWGNAPLAEVTAPVLVNSLTINAHDLLPASGEYFHYMGSLTTPPCSEGVEWIVLKKSIQASRKQLQFLQEVFKTPNNRPIQPQDGRMIVERKI